MHSKRSPGNSSTPSIGRTLTQSCGHLRKTFKQWMRSHVTGNVASTLWGPTFDKQSGWSMISTRPSTMSTNLCKETSGSLPAGSSRTTPWKETGRMSLPPPLWPSGETATAGRSSSSTRCQCRLRKSNQNPNAWPPVEYPSRHFELCDRSLADGVSVVCRSRPEVPDQRDHDAPGDGHDGAVADRRAQQQSTQGLDHRCEGLILGEPAHPRRHRVWGDEAAADEGAELEYERGAVGSCHCLGRHPKRDRKPGQGQGQQRNKAENLEPLDRSGGGSKAGDQRYAHDEDHAYQRPDQAPDDAPGQDGGAGDRHEAKAGDNALCHVHVDPDGGCRTAAADGHHQDPGDEVVDIRTGGAEAGAHSTAEDKDEQQQHDGRRPDSAERHHGEAPQMPKNAAKHSGGITQGVSAHLADSSVVTGWPVRAK